jgi:glycosyltransferase involved in cell wall biosynthesis
VPLDPDHGTELFACRMMPVVHSAADVFASLSRHEAFGLTVIEAAAGGCRLVLRDIPAHRELAGYFPAANVTLIPSDAAPAAVADAIAGAASLGRLPTAPPWPLPGWAEMVERVVAGYAEATGDDAFTAVPGASSATLGSRSERADWGAVVHVASRGL